MNPQQLGQLKLAANAELNLLVQQRLSGPNRRDDATRQGWLGRFFFAPPKPQYEQLWDRVRDAEDRLATANDQDAVKREILDLRLRLVNELQAINQNITDGFGANIAAVINFIQTIYGQINSANDQIPEVQFASTRRDCDYLPTPVAHLEALEQARNLTNDDTQKLQLLKRKIWFAKNELEKTDIENRDRVQEILEADLAVIFDIIQIHDGAHRATHILGAWTDSESFSPVVSRDLESEAPDVYAPFRAMLSREQQFQLTCNFRQVCIRGLKQLIQRLNEDDLNQLERKRKFYEELYYQQCELEQIQTEHQSIQAVDSDEDSTDGELNIDQPTQHNSNANEISETLKELHRIRGRMKALVLTEQNPNQAIVNRVKAPVVQQIRAISPAEQAELQQVECESEIQVLNQLNPQPQPQLQTVLNSRKDQEIQAIRAQIAEAEKEWLASQSEIASSASLAAPSFMDQSPAALKLNQLNELLLQKLQEHRSHDLWKATDWGRILLNGTASQGILGFLSKDFEKEIDKISRQLQSLVKRHQDALQSRIGSLKPGELPTIAASSNTPASKSIEELNQEINQEKIHLLSAFLERIIDKLGEYAHEEVEREKNGTLTEVRRGVIRQRKQTLNEAYRLLMDQYRVIPRPQKNIADFAREEVTDLVTMGFYSAKTYVKPEEFDTQKKFAEVGYSIQRGMEELNKFRGETPQEIITTMVGRFLKWADRHPNDAIRLVSDVLLTISMLQDKPLVERLSQQVNTKIWISVQLGTLGREEEPPFTEEDVWVITFARLARFGPQVASANQALKRAGEQLFQGNILGALWAGVTTYAGQRYEATAIQRHVENSSLNELQMVKIALDLAQGHSMQEIAQAQAAIEMTRAVGNLRRAFLAPGAVMKSAIKWLAEPFQEFYRASGGFTERITRLSLMTITHIPTTGFVASIVLGGTGLSMSGVMLGSLAVLVTGVFMHAIYTRYVNPVLNRVWQETRRRIRRMEHQAIAETHRQTHIERNATNYLDQLQQLKIVPSAPVAIEGETSLFNLTKRRISQVTEAITHALVTDFEQQLSGNNLPLKKSNEYVKIYLETLNREALEHAITVRREFRNLPPQMREEVIERTIAGVKHRVAMSWLRDRLRETSEREFIESYESFSKITDLDALEAKIDSEEEALSTIKEEAVSKITADITKEADLNHQERERIKARVRSAVERR